VIVAPPFGAVSTTTVPRDIPLTILLLLGKFDGSGFVLISNAVTRTPCRAIRSARGPFSGG
jgi:hypothetical protein